MKRITAILLVATFASISLSAVDAKKAQYIGGTIATIPDNTEGTLDTRNERALVFIPQKKGVDALAIPYDAITELEYGQKAGRRVAVAVLVSPLALFSKKRKHYLTVSYRDEAGKEQAVVLEVGKDIVRPTLTIVETRSGKEIQFQDDEARKAGRGGA